MYSRLLGFLLTAHWSLQGWPQHVQCLAEAVVILELNHKASTQCWWGSEDVSSTIVMPDLYGEGSRTGGNNPRSIPPWHQFSCMFLEMSLAFCGLSFPFCKMGPQFLSYPFLKMAVVLKWNNKCENTLRKLKRKPNPETQLCTCKRRRGKESHFFACPLEEADPDSFSSHCQACFFSTTHSRVWQR